MLHLIWYAVTMHTEPSLYERRPFNVSAHYCYFAKYERTTFLQWWQYRAASHTKQLHMHVYIQTYITKTIQLTFHLSFCRSPLFALQYAWRCKPNTCGKCLKNSKQISAQNHIHQHILTRSHTHKHTHSHTTLSNTNLCTIGDSREQSAATDRHYLPTNRHSNYCARYSALFWFLLFGLVCFYLLVVLNSLFF